MLPFILFNIIWISWICGSEINLGNFSIMIYLNISSFPFSLSSSPGVPTVLHFFVVVSQSLDILFFFLVFVPFAFQFSTFLFVYPQAQRLILPLSMSSILVSSSKAFFISFTAFKKFFWWFPYDLHLSVYLALLILHAIHLLYPWKPLACYSSFVLFPTL